MRVQLLKEFEGRKAGEITDVRRAKAAEMIAAGIAEVCEDQTRTDLPPPKEPEQTIQNITVNNFFPGPEPGEWVQENEEEE